jgi:oligopeptide transport system permease protein
MSTLEAIAEDKPPAPLPVAEVEKGNSLWQDAWRRLLKNRLAVVGVVVIGLVAALCLLAPGLERWKIIPNPNIQNLSLYATPPSAAHWFGTDTLGRDLFARVLYGGRISLAVGLVATAVALIIGVIYGAVSGFFGGKIDAVMMRFVDILYSIPFTIFVILLTVFTKDIKIGGHSIGEEYSIYLMFAAIGAVEWLTMARIVRGQIRSLRKLEFIEAAEALGLRRRRIIFRHMVPNVLGPVIVYTTLTIPAVMLFEAFLSFLGLGVQPPNASWGVLIGDGQKSMEEFPWLLIFPGLALAVTLFSFNFLGDGLRDALDPRASKD